MFKPPRPISHIKNHNRNNDNYDYEAVNEEELVAEDDDDAEDNNDDQDNPDYLRNDPPLSAIDVDIRIVRQKMSFAEATLELIRVSFTYIFFRGT